MATKKKQKAKPLRTINVSLDIHKKLRVAAAVQGKSIGDVVAAMVEDKR